MSRLSLLYLIDDFIAKRDLAQELTKEELIIFLEGTNSNGFLSKIQNLDVLHESLYKIIIITIFLYLRIQMMKSHLKQ